MWCSACGDRRRSRRIAWRAARSLAAAAGGMLMTSVSLTACGLGAGRAPSAVQLTVTRDFGARPLHAWRAPRLHGVEGKRLPVRVDCVSVGSTACTTVTSRLRAAGVPAAVAGIGASGGPQTLRVVVGPAAALLAGEASARALAGGPRASGVYARLAARGGALELLDPDGRSVRTLRAGSGLIAATRTGSGAPEWVVTGTDSAGVARAAA